MSRPVCCLALLTSLLAGPSSGSAADPLDRAWLAADGLAEAIVLVEYVLEREGRGFGTGGQRVELAATGVIATPEGLVLLSDNIFPEKEQSSRATARPTGFLVRLGDGQRMPAELVGRDEARGLCFLRLSSTGPHPHADFREGAPLRRGAPVLVARLLPERYGFAPSFQRAAVGAVLARPVPLLDLDLFLQDASIGAPVLDAEGRVAGLVTIDRFENGGPTAGPDQPLTLISSVTRGKAAGYPVLLPSAAFLEAIANPPAWTPEDPRVRAWLGVTLQEVDRKLASYLGLRGPSGILVTSVWEDSPADDAGIRPEDVILKFDGADVLAPDDEAIMAFIDRVQRKGVGAEVELDVLRREKRRTFRLTLGEAPVSALQAEEYRSEELGLVAQDLTMDIIQGRGWPRDTRGTLVSELEMAGAAMVGGLQRGDLILAVDGAPIGDIADLRGALESALQGRRPEIVFFVLRDPDTLFVVVKGRQ